MAGQAVYILPEEARRRPLTARNLEDYALCPRKYMLSFFEPPGGVRRFLGGPAALGRALRRAIIEFHRLGGVDEVGQQRLVALFEEYWEPALCADSLEEEKLHAEGVEMITAYYERVASGQAEWAAGQARVVEVDLRMEVEIEGEWFVAVADLVVATQDQGRRLVRFTSARRPPGPGELAKDTSALLLLAVGKQHFAGHQVEVGYCRLRGGRLIVPQITEQALAQFTGRVVQQARIMRQDKEFEPRKGKQCRWCRSRSQCPVWRKH